MIVSDNGPGVAIQDRQAIFESGFTRKPAGRGLGLYISRQVLDREGYEITLDVTTLDSGAVFRIEPEAETER